METSIARRVASRHLARQVPLGAEQLRQVQRDAETFAKNAEVLDNETDHARVQKAAYAWRNATRPLFNETMKFVVGIADNMSDRKKADRLVATWRAKFSPLFDVVLQIGSFPDWQYWQRLAPEWIRNLRVTAAKIDSVVKYLGTLTKQKMTPQVHELTSEHRTLEGFHVKLVEYDAENPKHEDALEVVREAFKVYQHRAREVLPLLLKQEIAFDIDFSRTDSLWGSSGLYGNGRIEINPFSAGNPKALAKTLAHEMGHHLFQVWLTEPKKNFWRGALSKDWTELDLTEVLAEWNKRDEYWAAFMVDLMKTEPILYLQLEGSFDHSKAMPKELQDDGWSRENLQRYLASGKKRTIRVPSSPITAYAASKPEEAFCEAVGMLVAYGSRAVLPLVREWLRVMFGGQVKLATIAY